MKSIPTDRSVNYGQLKNPFPSMDVFSSDEIENMHETALITLERLGLKVLLPEARDIFRKAGAQINDAEEMIYIGRDIIEAALKTAPNSISCKAGSSHRDLTLELGSLVFQPGAGAP